MEDFSQMNVLVTGAAGFIGSHLVEELLKVEKCQIIGIDNLSNGQESNITFLESIDLENQFTFIKTDIKEFNELNKILKEYKIKRIYHLAAIVDVQETIRNPLLSNETNVKGTLNLLEASRLNNIKRIVFSSSAAVYGEENTLPKNETSLIEPISPYGYEKLMGEQYMKLYNKMYGIETVSLRYFNVYGERQNAKSDYSGVISIFEEKFLNSERPIVYGDGEQYRDFIYVKDVVKANINAMKKSKLKCEIICVGTASKISINKLIEFMNKKHNKHLQAKYLKSRAGDIRESICDNTKLLEFLNLKDMTKFEEGIMKI